MKFTVSAVILCTLLLLNFATARRDTPGPKKPKVERPRTSDFLEKGKREAALLSYSHGGPPRTSHVLHLPAAGGSSSLNIGAGYSLGAPKGPSFSYSSPVSFGGGSHHFPGSSSSFGQSYAGQFHSSPASFGGDFSHGGGKTRYTSISGSYKSPLSSAGKFSGFFNGGSSAGLGSSSHFGLSSSAPQSFGHSQFVSAKPQMTYGVPQYAAYTAPKAVASYTAPVTYTMHSSQPSQTHQGPSLQSYASGIQGLGAYATSGTPLYIQGPLFMPAASHESTPAVTYGSPVIATNHGFSFGGGIGGGVGGGSFGDHGSSSGSSGKFAGFFGTEETKPTYEAPESAGPVISSNYGAPASTNTQEFKPSLYLGSSESGGHDSANSLGIPASAHAALLSGTPIYLAPKAVAEALKGAGFNGGNIVASQDSFHGSASLTGNHEIPSAGHAAPLVSFGGEAHQGYSADSDSGSHGSLSTTYGAPFGGQAGFQGHLGSDHGSQSLAFGSVINHGQSSSSHSLPSSTYGVPFSGGYSSSNKYEAAPSFGGNGHSFAGIGHSTGSFSSFAGHSEPKESYLAPHKSYGPPKGSYSTKSNVYSSAPSEFEPKYDTIKYSRDISESEILHGKKLP